ncbi:MAG: GMC family oxidoreductase [Xanthomonadales bacterium]|jgi:choline dehydrogenase-like flavoprotein|nr:GMC family oxidoreductase [Xanthomonadales bacterium]
MSAVDDAGKTRAEPDYDVVIVGAGMVGCVLARHLTQAGRRVLLLEAGKADALTYHGYQSYVERSYVMPSRPNAPYPQNDAAGMPGIPYPESEESDPTAWVNPKTQYWIQTGPVPFGSDYARALGGTSLHWLGIAMRHVPRDFELESKYKWGRDWPVSYDDMEPYYRRAEYELGVSADVGEQTYCGAWFADGYVFPMQSFPMTYLDYTLNDDIAGMTFTEDEIDYPIEIVPVPQARNGMPNPNAFPRAMTAMEGPLAWQAENPDEPDPPYVPVGNPSTRGVGLGDRCEGNSSCIPICPVQAKYNAGKSLAVADREFLDFRSQCVASKLHKSEDGSTITGLDYIHYGVSPESAHTTHTVTARIYVLAAHCVENAKICLMSDVANRSDQVGRNLMDHPYINFSGKYPKKIWGYRGPDVTGGMPLMRDGVFREKRAAFRTDIGNWGWVFPQGSPNTVVDDMVEKQGLYGRALREQLEKEGPTHMRIGYLIEQLPDPKNRVTLADENGEQELDPLGLPRPFVYYDVDDYTLAGMDAARKLTEAIFDKVGIEGLEQARGSGTKTYHPPDEEKQTFQFFGSGHLIGTHIMGDDPEQSVVDAWQKAHDHDNLFLAGCGSHPTSATANPSLTMTAMTFRTFDRIQEMLPSQEAGHDE